MHHKVYMRHEMLLFVAVPLRGGVGVNWKRSYDKHSLYATDSFMDRIITHSVSSILTFQRGAERIPQVIRSWDDRIATETLQKFRSVVSDVEADLSGRKVLAAILLYDKKTDTLSVVSLGTGMLFTITGFNYQ